MRQQQNNWKQGRWNQEQRMKTHAKCHKDGHHRQSATMTKNRGQDHQNGKNNGQRQARRQAEIARGRKKTRRMAQWNRRQQPRSKIPKKQDNQNNRTHTKKHAKSKHQKKHETIAIARTSSVAQKISKATSRHSRPRPCLLSARSSSSRDSSITSCSGKPSKRFSSAGDFLCSNSLDFDLWFWGRLWAWRFQHFFFWGG